MFKGISGEALLFASSEIRAQEKGKFKRAVI
jgi:uncharacterized protein YoaH (UPF0181 family)